MCLSIAFGEVRTNRRIQKQIDARSDVWGTLCPTLDVASTSHSGGVSRGVRGNSATHSWVAHAVEIDNRRNSLYSYLENAGRKKLDKP